MTYKMYKFMSVTNFMELSNGISVCVCVCVHVCVCASVSFMVNVYTVYGHRLKPTHLYMNFV